MKSLLLLLPLTLGLEDGFMFVLEDKLAVARSMPIQDHEGPDINLDFEPGKKNYLDTQQLSVEKWPHMMVPFNISDAIEG